MDLTVDDFDYALPAELIAQFPLAERTASHLLVVAGERREDRRFAELPTLGNAEGMNKWITDSEAARILAERLRNDHA